jgi:cytochrome d ubiquinol oxidase subunit I
MLFVSWLTLFLIRRRGVANVPPLILRGLVAMSFSGWLATLAGWYVTEIGRQPWLVTGVLSTKDAVSDVPAGMIASTLAMYLIVYALLLAAYVAVIFQLARRGGVTPAQKPMFPLPGIAEGPLAPRQQTMVAAE